MKLEKLLERMDYKVLAGSTDIEISTLVYDSRKVEKASVFVCISGAVSDAHDFIPDVVKKGAAAVVVEKDVTPIEGVTYIKVDDTRLALACMSAAYFDYPAEKIKTIGITGTKASSLPQEEPVPEKWVCLTFDDGPSKTTPAVLDALNAAGVKATFFVVATGYNEKYLPLIADAAAAGHQISLHSASHEYSDIYQSADAYWQDIELLKERISPYVNTASLHYLRFPGGSTNTVSRRYGGRGVMAELKQQCAEKGYAYVDWNVCAEDAVGGKPSAGTIYRNVVRETGEQTQCIVLMHDSATTRTTAEALPDIIQWYRDQGFTFCRVEQVLPAP